MAATGVVAAARTGRTREVLFSGALPTSAAAGGGQLKLAGGVSDIVTSSRIGGILYILKEMTQPIKYSRNFSPA
jgi:hypothetical protein